MIVVKQEIAVWWQIYDKVSPSHLRSCHAGSSIRAGSGFGSRDSTVGWVCNRTFVHVNHHYNVRFLCVFTVYVAILWCVGSSLTLVGGSSATCWMQLENIACILGTPVGFVRAACPCFDTKMARSSWRAISIRVIYLNTVLQHRNCWHLASE